MTESELKKAWQIANEKLEMSIIASRNNTVEINQLKVYHFISSMKGIKFFTLLCGIIWVGLGSAILISIYLNQFKYANKFFLFSASIQVTLTAIAILIYLYQIINIYSVNITEPVLKTQEKISRLRSSTLLVTRILILQLPVWTTFYWNDSMIENGSLILWIIQTLVTLSFTFAALWLFFNIKFENRGKKWFRLIFEGREWTPLLKAMELSEEIQKYKLEKK